MKKYVAVLGLLAMGVGAFASDITIYDGISDNNYYNPTDNSVYSSNPGAPAAQWYGEGNFDVRGVKEDQEVESVCVGTQQWDLEAFTLNNNKLGLVGGYDFKNVYEETSGGDIFIATGSAPSYGVSNTGGGSGYAVVQNNFGYDYAIDLVYNPDGKTGTYNVYALNNASTVTVFYQQNDESNPWQYSAGGTLKTTGTFSYASGLSDAASDGYVGGSHNQISGIDLSFLGSNTEFWSHYTMSCGNDNLMGHGTTAVPEPGSLMLFGTGLLGLIGLSIGRRKKK